MEKEYIPNLFLSLIVVFFFTNDYFLPDPSNTGSYYLYIRGGVCPQRPIKVMLLVGGERVFTPHDSLRLPPDEFLEHVW